MKFTKPHIHLGNCCAAGAAALALGILSASTVSAEVVAGWDTWESTTAPTPSVTAAGVFATATSSAINVVDEVISNVNWSNTDGSGRGSSGDATWGTFNVGIPASTVTDVGSANFTLTNAKTEGEITFTISNDGEADLNLDAFHFDAFAFRPKAARTYTLTVLEGSAITEGEVFTSDGAPMNDNSTNDITHLGGGIDDSHTQHDQIDIDLTGIADSTLEVGGTVIFQLVFSNGAGDGSGGHHLFLDNVAVTTAPATTNKLVFTSVPASATAATDFSVTVEAQDAGGAPLMVTQDTEISLLSSGTGALIGNTATIPMGSSSVTLNSVQSNLAEEITLTAIKTSGDALLPSEASLSITIDAGEASQIVIETEADGSGDPVTDQKLLLGGTLDLFSISRDAGGNFIDNVVATWTLENITGDIVSDDLFDNGDGSAVFDPFEAGSATIRASFGSLSDGVSGVITAADLVNRYDGGTNSSPNWSTEIVWESDILPDFSNQTDLFFFEDSITKRNSYLGFDVTVRSINFNEPTTGNYINSFVLAGNNDPANFTFDTDSETDPAEFNVGATTETNITFGFSGASTAAGRGVMYLADDLLVTHNGTGGLTLNADILEIDGPNGITKEGTGTLIVSGTNSYTGNTIVKDGVLRVTGNSIPDTTTLVIEGGVVDVTEDEYVVGLSIPGMPNLPEGEYGSTDSGVANPDDTNFTGFGRIIVGPPPVADVITITDITRTGTSVTLEFTSSGDVDVYRSTDLMNWGDVYEFDVPSGTYTDSFADGDRLFYILVTAGDPAP